MAKRKFLYSHFSGKVAFLSAALSCVSLLQVGEDTFLHLWHFPEGDDGSGGVERIFSDRIDDAIFVGVAFSADGSERILASLFEGDIQSWETAV